MSIGERITELRKMQNLSQGQLAQAMDVSRQAVSKWENDLSCPDITLLPQLARRNYGRRPPVVLKTVETVEKVIEKPVVRVVEKVVEKPVEKTVVQYVEKPVIKKVFRTKYLRNPAELAIVGIVCFLLGLLVGYLL